MPFAVHERLTLSGQIGLTGEGVEKFTFGVSLEKQANGPDFDNDQYADIVADCTAFFGRASTGISGHARLTEIKVARIGADGKYVRDPFIAAVSVGGGGSSSSLPAPQTALCVSLQTARRGPSGKGRFYLPLPIGTPEPGTFLLPTAFTDGVRGSVVTWLDALNNEPNLDVLNLQVVVASTKGYNTAVTGVRVGRVLDTVRSRRRSLDEQYGATTALASNT